MRNLLIESTFLFFLPFLSCQGQNSIPKTDTIKVSQESNNEIEQFYQENQGNDAPSISIGTVSLGSLKNGKIMPFQGENYRYFDTVSYTSGRAFVNEKLKKSILESYSELESQLPDRQFCLMECSNEEGGKINPHRTHQNGLSVDFMTPLKQNGKAYYGLDSLGASHYLLDFNDSGLYTKDSSISIDFETMAQHIWILEKHARMNGLKISKIILKMELKDELFKTVFGKKLSTSTIYITKNLSPIINSLHDDHYHIDFEVLEE